MPQRRLPESQQSSCAQSHPCPPARPGPQPSGLLPCLPAGSCLRRCPSRASWLPPRRARAPAGSDEEEEGGEKGVGVRMRVGEVEGPSEGCTGPCRLQQLTMPSLVAMRPMAVDSPPGMTRPTQPSSCSAVLTSLQGTPSCWNLARCSRKEPCRARTPMDMVGGWGSAERGWARGA